MTIKNKTNKYTLHVKYLEIIDDVNISDYSTIKTGCEYKYGYDYFEGTEKEFDKYFEQEYIGNDMHQKCIGIEKN